MPALLDLFCGVGGWSKGFLRRGWRCVGVDVAAFGYPGEFIQCDVRELTRDFIDGFDAVAASPPCEEFARASLPWLRGDGKPDEEHVALLRWSVALCDRPNRIVECSRFATRHAPGAVMNESYALWGDVPLLMPAFVRRKTYHSGKFPERRAEIPRGLSDCIAMHFGAQLR